MSVKLPISLVIVTFNEEKNIGRCLSAADFCAERIVIDSGSTDRTLEIAKEHGATVLHRDWTGYRDQKNFGTDAATRPWVLCIDADEVVTPELRSSIESAFETEPAVDGFEINRHGLYAGKLINHSGWYPEWRTFLYRKGCAQWIGLEPHTAVGFSGRSRQRLTGDLLHYTYDDIAEHVRKHLGAARDSARAMFESGRRPSVSALLLRPPYASFRRYVMQLGFLDGFYGFVISAMAGVYTFLKYAYLWEHHLHRASRRQQADDRA